MVASLSLWSTARPTHEHISSPYPLSSLIIDFCGSKLIPEEIDTKKRKRKSATIVCLEKGLSTQLPLRWLSKCAKSMLTVLNALSPSSKWQRQVWFGCVIIKSSSNLASPVTNRAGRRQATSCQLLTLTKAVTATVISVSEFVKTNYSRTFNNKNVINRTLENYFLL